MKRILTLAFILIGFALNSKEISDNITVTDNGGTVTIANSFPEGSLEVRKGDLAEFARAAMLLDDAFAAELPLADRKVKNIGISFPTTGGRIRAKLVGVATADGKTANVVILEGRRSELRLLTADQVREFALKAAKAANALGNGTSQKTDKAKMNFPKPHGNVSVSPYGIGGNVGISIPTPVGSVHVGGYQYKSRYGSYGGTNAGWSF